MTASRKEDHLFGPGPKRILALDGGGLRGIVSLGFLSRIECILRKRFGKGCVLSDYFDLIGGTSTGAIIATFLALGLEVQSIQELYQQLASEVFRKQVWRVGLVGAKFPHEPLMRALQCQLGDTTLGSDKLRTGLVIIAKRLDTGSPWILCNNPKGHYFNAPPDGTEWVPNRDLLLRQLIRASAAAPHYFEPERIEVAPGIEAAFVDGGVSPFNNPALQLLLVANLEGFGLRWPLGADQLLLVSVGTGSTVPRVSTDEVMRMPAAMLSVRALASMIEDCEWFTQTILQWMSHSQTSWRIDGEVQDLRNDLLGTQSLLSYLRYNVHLDSQWIKQTLKMEVSPPEAELLYQMDEPGNVSLLQRLGERAASVQISTSHFPARFDPQALQSPPLHG